MYPYIGNLWCLFYLQSCGVHDSTTRTMFTSEEGFGDEDERMVVRLRYLKLEEGI